MNEEWMTLHQICEMYGRKPSSYNRLILHNHEGVEKRKVKITVGKIKSAYRWEYRIRGDYK